MAQTVHAEHGGTAQDAACAVPRSKRWTLALRLDDKHKALLRLIDRVNHDSPRMPPDDFAPARAAGWTDGEPYFAVTVCALFNFYNRWIDATGVHALSDEGHREGGRRSAAGGYVRE